MDKWINFTLQFCIGGQPINVIHLERFFCQKWVTIWIVILFFTDSWSVALTIRIPFAKLTSISKRTIVFLCTLHTSGLPVQFIILSTNNSNKEYLKYQLASFLSWNTTLSPYLTLLLRTHTYIHWNITLLAKNLNLFLLPKNGQRIPFKPYFLVFVAFSSFSSLSHLS